MPAVMLGLFALTLFVSASLIFLIEPMVGKLMLPLLGGTPAVWNTCMLFFQAVLLAGYLYAHLTTKYLGPRRQAWLHLGILVLPLLFFAINGPLTINPSLVEGREGNPIFALLLVLTVSVFVPMFVVCTSASVLQRWFADTDHPAAGDPYFLYGASNLGSMLALIAYPFFVEPTFTLSSQRVYWCFGFAILAVLIGLCAYMMWNSAPPRAATGSTPGPRAGGTNITPARDGVRKDAPLPAEPASLPSEELTWLRRLRWTVLSIVPSSLMLGVTTYITTDIAAIPLLWVLPLILYLATFIIVFAVIKPMSQNVIVVLGIWGLAWFLGFYLTPQYFEKNSVIRYIIVAGSLGACIWAFQIFTLRDKELIHHVMVMIMPLLVLLLIFIILAGIEASHFAKIALHVATFFVVCMVCHGELARDRPAPVHLTEFFLIMSIGGVIGGLFNALVAPIAFHALIEYQLVMMIACMLVPPLGLSRDSIWARRADLALAGVFVGVGSLLMYMYWRDFSAPFTGENARAVESKDLPLLDWHRAAWAFVPGLLFGCLAAWQKWGTPPADPDEKPQDHWIDRTLDVVLPLGLFLLVLGLYWGLPSNAVAGRVSGFADLLKLKHEQFRNILTFGLPAVLCYTFVERSLRFGLGVGAILLAAGMSMSIREGVLHQERSFFGVLKVESSYARYPEDRGYQARAWYPVHRLVHGTTLHGKQFLEPALRGIPSSYYHSTGPVGQLIRAYNNPLSPTGPKVPEADWSPELKELIARKKKDNDIDWHPPAPIAVIGLGTGTVATYAVPGQALDYYDIDAHVIDIAFDTNEFFTYIEDAEDRGATVSIILGDARLTFDTNNPAHRRAEGDSSRGVPRLLPLRKRKGEPTPPRKFGKALDAHYKYGLIFADAFSSDAIPMHLLTKEAIDIYLSRLLENGVLCVHISNRHLDLSPVLANIVSELREKGIRDGKGNLIEEVPNAVGYQMSDDDETAPGKSRSSWIVIARDKKHIERLWQVPQAFNDEGQMALLGAALLPATGPGMVSGCGLAYRLIDVAREASFRAAEEEGRPYDAKNPLSRTKWEPLETSHDIEERVAAARPELVRATNLNKALQAKVAALELAQKAALEAMKKPQDEYKARAEDEAKIGAEIEQALLTSPEYKKALDEEAAIKIAIDDADTREEVVALRVKRKQAEERTKTIRARRIAADSKLVALEGKFKDARDRTKEAKARLDALGDKEADAQERLDWAKERAASVRIWHKRLEKLIDPEEIKKRLQYNKRVGVWTDDFSNIWSVMSIR